MIYEIIIFLIIHIMCFNSNKFDPEKAGYVQVFQENFKEGIDWNKWDWREPWSGDNPTTKENTVWLKECVNNDISGIKLTADQLSATQNKCGLIQSNNFLNFKYGFIEVECMMPPNGFTYFPAIWLYYINGWYEIDIVELMGEKSNHFSFTHHWQNDDLSHGSEGKSFTHCFDLSKKSHKFAVEWTENKISWFIDRKKYYEVHDHIPQVPMFLIINIGSGGDPAYSKVFDFSEVPKSMIVNNITLYQK